MTKVIIIHVIDVTFYISIAFGSELLASMYKSFTILKFCRAFLFMENIYEFLFMSLLLRMSKENSDYIAPKCSMYVCCRNIYI